MTADEWLEAYEPPSGPGRSGLVAAGVAIVLALLLGVVLGLTIAPAQALPETTDWQARLEQSEQLVRQLEMDLASLEHKNDILEASVVREQVMQTAIQESVTESGLQQNLTVGPTYQALFYTIFAPDSLRCADFVAVDLEGNIQVMAVAEVYSCQ